MHPAEAEGDNGPDGADCVCGGRRTKSVAPHEKATLRDFAIIVPARVKGVVNMMRERIEVVVVVLGGDSVADRLGMSDQMERCCFWSISSEQPRWSDENQTILCGRQMFHIWDVGTMNFM